MHRTTRSQPLPRTTLISALALGLFAVIVPLSLFACDVAPQDGEGDEPPPPSQEPEEASGTEERSLPPEHRRVLDALQDSEQNLERHRARTRAARENRRVEQDW